MTAGLVSVIVPVYNRPCLLVEAVESALGQTYRPIEIVIVDDGSTDETGDVSRDLVRQYPTEVVSVSQSHAGVAEARNAGLRRAHGEYIQFLDSDDLLMPDKFERQVAALRADASCGVSYGYTRQYWASAGRRDVPARRTGEHFVTLFPDLLSGRLWATPTPLYRRRVIDAAGSFLALSMFEDWEFECRVAALGVRLHHCRAFVADVRRLPTHNRAPRLAGLRLQHYAEAHRLALEHARRAGVAADVLDRFSATLFRIACLCGAEGSVAEADRCADAALSATRSGLARNKMRGHRAASSVLGWRRANAMRRRVARWTRTLSGRRPATRQEGARP